MNRVALLSSAERSTLFQASAQAIGISPVMIEKDFWVTWTLDRIFRSPALTQALIFKGGTSLSKVFGAISRFSEDIDLILDWRLLGYGPGPDDPWKTQTSRNQQDKFNKQANAKAVEYIATTLLAQLKDALSGVPDLSLNVDPDDGHTVNVAYPASFKDPYIRPEIRLEIGPLGAWLPSSVRAVKAYAAEAFPHVFEQSEVLVPAIAAERTFWEKVTILHQEAHRAGASPSRYSRHYYDVHQLATSAFKTSAMADLQLLNEVVSFKDRFYPVAWARFDLAKPGTLRLTPSDQNLTALRSDYRAMAPMLFGDVPTFDQILQSIADLEGEINRLGR